MPPRLAPPQTTQIDRAVGVFETMLVSDSRIVELDVHLARLAASTDYLYGARAPGLRELVTAATPTGLARLRLTVRPTDDRGELDVDVRSFPIDRNMVLPGPELGPSLQTCVVEAGLGGHKWADRSALQQIEDSGPVGSVPLLVLDDGSVLEAARGNIVAVSAKTLITPPLDGRILPGIARARVLELADEAGLPVREQTLRLDELLAADEVFLTGSIRGVEPVVKVDDRELSVPRDGVTAILSAALRRRWQLR